MNFLNTLVQSYGPFGLFFAMIIQTIIAPIPSEILLTLASAVGIKVIDVVIFGSLGSIIGSLIAFYIARVGGKPIVERLIGKKWLGKVDNWIEKGGMKAIFLARIIPIVPFDLISYITGVTSIKFSDYLLATALGTFPRSFILAMLGLSMREIIALLNFSIEITIVAFIIGFLILAYLDRKGYLNLIRDFIVEKLSRKFT